jgi:hypothetical protein
MSAALLVLLPPILLAAFGLAAAFHPAVAPLGIAARLCAAFAAGAVALTAEAVIFSLLRVPWTVPGLGLPLLGLSVPLALVWSRRPTPISRLGPCRPGKALAAAAALAAFLALGHLTASLWTARASSVDDVYFWGVKAARFAEARGIDASLLGWPYFFHAAPDYPPLFPVLGAWNALLTGGMQWRGNLLASAFWLVAAIPLVLAFLRRRLGDAGATTVTAFWTVALAASLAFSYSGGNAEAPLLFFETVAGAALLAEKKGDLAGSRFLPALALAGAVLTKVEGSVGAALLVAGVLLRDRLEKRERVLARAVPLFVAPLCALVLWFGFQYASHLHVGYRAHGVFLDLHFEHLESVVRSALGELRAGTSGVSWLFPILVLILLGHDRRAALPGLLVTAGLLAFLVFDYLHDPGDPWERIGWTLPRASQPALSLLILSAGIAGFAGVSGRGQTPRTAFDPRPTGPEAPARPGGTRRSA